MTKIKKLNKEELQKENDNLRDIISDLEKFHNKVVQTTVYYNPSLRTIEDRVITSEYESEDAMLVSGLMFALEMFIPGGGIYVRDREVELLKLVKNGDYSKYYGIIQELAEQAKHDCR